MQRPVLGSPIGEVIVIRGADGIVGLRGAGLAVLGRPTVGKFLSIATERSLAIGLITEVTADLMSVAQTKGFDRSARIDLVGEICTHADGSVSFQRGVSAYPDEIYTAPESWARRAYPNLVHYNRLPKGGHFAAWEQPQSFSEELRATFRSLR